MKVCVVDDNYVRGTSGVFYHRLHTPHNYMSKSGVGDYYLTPLFSTLDKHIKESIDLVIFNGIVPFKTTPLLEIEEMKRHAKVVMDIDDRYDDYSGFILEERKKLPLSYSYPKTYTQGIKEQLEVVDWITVSTEKIAEVVDKDNVTVLPNALSPETEEQYNQVVIKNDDDKLHIGFVGNAMHYYDGKVLEEALSMVEEKKDIVVHVLAVNKNKTTADGSPEVTNQLCDELSLNGEIEVVRHEYKKVDSYYPEIASMDLMIAPLSDIPFNEGKSNLRALECALAGIPLIAQNAEAYRGVPCLKFDNPKYLAYLIDMFARDKGKLKEYGEVMRQWGKGRTMKGVIGKRIELYKGLIED